MYSDNGGGEGAGVEGESMVGVVPDSVHLMPLSTEYVKLLRLLVT